MKVSLGLTQRARVLSLLRESFGLLQDGVQSLGRMNSALLLQRFMVWGLGVRSYKVYVDAIKGEKSVV